MLIIAGLGVSPRSTAPLSLLERCRGARTYLDVYTTYMDEEEIVWLEEALGAIRAGREDLESPEKILGEASTGDVCLLVYGDPYIATTHQSLRVMAMRRGIPVRTIYSSSFINAVLGECGLHAYKLGFIGSILRGDVGSRNYVYRQVGRTLELRRHSVIIPTGYNGSLGDLFEDLSAAERNFKEGFFSDDTYLIAVSRAGKDDQRIVAGTLGELAKDKPQIKEPFSLVVPGELHFTEEEALEALGLKVNSNVKKSTAELRTSRIIQKVRNAVKKADQRLIDKYRGVFENSELYLRDAEELLAQGDPSTALMQAAYAEGLIDALRLLGEDIKWE